LKYNIFLTSLLWSQIQVPCSVGHKWDFIYYAWLTSSQDMYVTRTSRHFSFTHNSLRLRSFLFPFFFTS